MMALRLGQVSASYRDDLNQARRPREISPIRPSRRREKGAAFMPIPRQINNPLPGYWLIRLIRNGPPVPACIKVMQTTHEPGEPENRMERSAFLAAFINGQPVDIDRVWMVRGQPITQQEYEYRCAVTDWAMVHAAQSPEAQPTKRIDLAHTAPVYRRKGT